MQVRGILLRGKWTQPEIDELHKVLDVLPEAWVEKNPHFRVLERQSVLTGAPASAPGHSKYNPRTGTIVVFDKGVYHGDQVDPEQFRRSVYHELAHTILRRHPQLLKQWVEKTRGDGFVDDYAKTSPEEDFCDTFSEFLIHDGKTRDAVPQKAAFMSDLLARASHREKVAMFNAFADELIKTAARAGAIKEMISRAMKVPGVRKGLVVGGAAGGGGALGLAKGKEKGLEEGTAHMDAGMRQAYRVGLQRGAQYGARMVIRQLQGQGQGQRG